MNHLSSDILSMSGEAGVLIEKNRISYLNPAAVRILGADCQGKTVAAVFGEDVAGNQASEFVGDAPIKGKHYILRASRSGSTQIIFFSPPAMEDLVLGDSFIVALKDSLSTMSLCLERAQGSAESIGDSGMLENLSSMSRAYFRMRRMVNNAALAKNIAAGEVRVEPTVLDLSDFCGKLLGTVEELYPQYRFQRDLGERIQVKADYLLIEQLLLNLISNAMVHATGRDKISLSLTATDSGAVISVSDNGCGIKPEELHAVFKRYKYGYSVGELGKGAGLGLSVCAGVAEMHGGTLLMESRPGHGTTIRVSLGRNTGATVKLRDVETPQIELKTILTGLSDSLPAEYFSEKYMD